MAEKYAGLQVHAYEYSEMNFFGERDHCVRSVDRTGILMKQLKGQPLGEQASDLPMQCTAVAGRGSCSWMTVTVPEVDQILYKCP